VMLTKSIRLGIFKVRYSVCDFIRFSDNKFLGGPLGRLGLRNLEHHAAQPTIALQQQL
jgi:hypothetical protein